jgi:hypothetical protein
MFLENKMTKINKIFSILFALIILVSCSDTSSNNDPTKETGIPTITSLTSDKPQIMYGGADLATLTCVATGGNLTYKWEVDLGDIIPVKSDKSVVTFSGAACCVGEKVIKCTVSNSLGNISKELKVFIIEEIKQPEIISIESNKSQLSLTNKEVAKLVCYGIGGGLTYNWQCETGKIEVDASDKSKITYTPTEKGTKTIKCTISNTKGSVSDTYQITVYD